MNKTTLVLAFFVAAILAGLYVRYMSRGLSAQRENFMQQSVGRPIGGPGMGPYDGLNAGGGVAGWASNEEAQIKTGTGHLPSDAEDPNKIMFLVGNKVSNEDCCPSAFNTDTGCVCLTAGDKQLMSTRGGNRA
jgi:hypothetical protein